MGRVERMLRALATVPFVLAVAGAAALQAKTFVYVANPDGGHIVSFRLDEDTGDLVPLKTVEAGKVVTPMAVSPDRRFLYAHVRARPTSVLTYAIDSATGDLVRLATVPLPHSAPFVSIDRTGRFLLSVAYGANTLAVSPISEAGLVLGEPVQVLTTGKQPHAVLADPSNRFVYATNLGADRLEQFVFDEKTGLLRPNDPAAVAFPAGTGPRHFRFAPNGRSVYVLSESQGTVTRLGVDRATGVLTVAESVSAVPASLGLAPGKPHDGRSAAGQAADTPDTRPSIWAADLHLLPNGRFLYASERTSSTLAVFAVEPDTGRLTYVKSVPTEAQPRGFRIDPRGRFLICAGEKSSDLSVFRIDQASGDLTLLKRYPVGPSASWIEIVDLH